MNETIKVIDIARDFSPFPFGRYRSHGRFSGEAFREDVLQPALRDSEASQVVVQLDDAVGLGSSFLEEAFGGLARSMNWELPQFKQRIDIVSRSDPSVKLEVEEYVRNALRSSVGA